MSILYIINLTAVGIFGVVLSAAFCDIHWTFEKNKIMAGSTALIFAFQGILYFLADPNIVECVYPIITHVPLILTLCVLSKKYIWSTVSVLTAYLCCQIRRWLALLVVAAFSGDFMMQYMTELFLTLPLLMFLVKFIAPFVRSISRYPISLQYQFGLVPALYYGFDYLTRIYTSLLSEGSLVAVEFMPFVCSLAYLLFAVNISTEKQIRSRLEQTQSIMNMQIKQAVREIEALRQSQKKTSEYRHDMRHHMQYLSTCIENGCLKQAQEYIQKICSEIEAGKMTAFCENEAANLIFSAFAKRAEDGEIQMQIRASIPQIIAIAESDLCVLLSNALENALHACQRQKEKELPAVIEVTVYEKNGKLLLQIINSCGEDITFDHEIPVTHNSGHGIGVQSICAIVEQYDGMYTFSVKDGKFILRISL